MNRSKLTEKGDLNVRPYIIKPYEMGLQVPHCIHPKMSQKRVVWPDPKNLGELFHELARQRESQIVEGHLCSDHVHMMVRIPPKYSVAQVIGYIKGKSAIRIARDFMGRYRNFKGYHFWARG